MLLSLNICAFTVKIKICWSCVMRKVFGLNFCVLVHNSQAKREREARAHRGSEAPSLLSLVSRGGTA